MLIRPLELETVQANLRLINPQFKPTWSQFRALAQAIHRFTRFRCLFFGIIRFCTYSSSEVIAKSAKKCKIWFIRFCKKKLTKICEIVICNLTWMLTQKCCLKLLLLNLISIIQRKAMNKHTKTSKMEVFTKLEFRKSKSSNKGSIKTL